jgi:hypothetical protein
LDRYLEDLFCASIALVAPPFRTAGHSGGIQAKVPNVTSLLVVLKELAWMLYGVKGLEASTS